MEEEAQSIGNASSESDLGSLSLYRLSQFYEERVAQQHECAERARAEQAAARRGQLRAAALEGALRLAITGTSADDVLADAAKFLAFLRGE